MLSQDSIDRLKYWRLQLRGVIADQEHRLKTLERRILTMGTASAPFLASLKVGKNTLAHLERTQSLLTKLIDAHDLFMMTHILPAAITATSPTTNMVPNRQMHGHRRYVAI